MAAEVERASLQIDEISVDNDGVWLNLGDLRQLVEACVAMSASADVLVHADPTEIRGELLVTKVIVREEHLL